MLVFEERGKPDGSTRRITPRRKEENQQQTQPTYDAESDNRTWDTLVGGKRSHQCAIPDSTLPPPEKKKKTLKKGNMIE